MHPIHLSLRLADGTRRTVQTLAPSTASAIEAVQMAYGEQLRGASARVLALRAPGLSITLPQPLRGLAANDARFGGEVMA